VIARWPSCLAALDVAALPLELPGMEKAYAGQVRLEALRDGVPE